MSKRDEKILRVDAEITNQNIAAIEVAAKTLQGKFHPNEEITEALVAELITVARRLERGSEPIES